MRVNQDITATKVRLVGVNGELLGILSRESALSKAEEAGTDMVEVAPNANPPVCRLMDYSKYKYAESKRQHELKLKQKQIQVKEIKFRPVTDDGDYAVKMRNIIRFIQEGNKVKVTLRFRGREITHQEFGIALLKRVEEDLKDKAIIEVFPKMEGRQITMILAPSKKK